MKVVGEKKEIKIGEVIGRGYQSKVFKGRFKDWDVAVKQVDVNKSTKEVEMLGKLHHQNIVKILYTDTDDYEMYIALELCEYTLKQHIESLDWKNPLTPIEVLKQVTEGLHYLHNGQTFSTVHGDLKPSNILFRHYKRDNNWTVKISDFGISNELKGDLTHVTKTAGRGSDGYIAPELLEQNTPKKIRKATDIFALGVVFYYTLTGGKHPFSDDPVEVNNKVRDCEPCLDELPSNYRNDAEDLILSMLEKDVTKRIKVDEVKCHHIFWDVKKKLDFFQKTSNYIEDRNKHQKLINEFEKHRKDIISGESWKEVIGRDSEVLKLLIEKPVNKKKKTTVQDLLRQIRNWSSHFFDKTTSAEVQTALGGQSELPTGFVKFFESHFPKLLSCSYKIMKTQKDKDNFREFYAVESAQSLSDSRTSESGLTESMSAQSQSASRTGESVLTESMSAQNRPDSRTSEFVPTESVSAQSSSDSRTGESDLTESIAAVVVTKKTEKEEDVSLKLKNNFLLEERIRSLAAQMNFYQSTSLLEELTAVERDIGLELISAECYIQLGREGKAEKAIKNVRKILMEPPMCDVEDVIKLATESIGNLNNVQGLVLLRIAGEMFKDAPSLSSDEKVIGIHRCAKKMKPPILSLLFPGNLDKQKYREGVSGRARAIAFDYGVSMTEEMLEDLKKIEGADPDKTVLQQAMFANMINNVYSKTGQHDKSLKILRTEVKNMEIRFGENKKQYQVYISMLANIGAELHNCEKFHEAERMKVLALNEIDHVLDYDDEEEKRAETKRIQQSLKETRSQLKRV